MDALDPVLFSASTYCRADLTQLDAACIINYFLHENGIERIDLLIHNAGIGSYGLIEQQPNATQPGAVNQRAPIALTHDLPPNVVQARCIVFISLVATALPACAVYAATKAALEAFAHNLCIELGGSAQVQIIAPGAIRTAMHKKVARCCVRAR